MPGTNSSQVNPYDEGTIHHRETLMVNHSPGHISVTHQGEYLPNATNINTPSQQAKTFYITPSMSQKLNYFVPTKAR